MKNRMKVIYAFIFLVGLFSSCEMRDEMTGGEDDPNTPKGILDLSLTYVAETKAATDIKVGDFRVSIYDDKGEEQAYYETYEELKTEPQVLLPVGTYRIVCDWGENKQAAFDSPYFSGDETCELKEQEVTKVNVSAELQNVKVNLKLSDDFFKYYKDDYLVIVSNGSHALMFDKRELRTAYFMPGTTLKYTIKATTLDGKKAELSGVLQNEAGTSEAGDVFTINIKTVPEIPDKPIDPDQPIEDQTGVSLKVDVTLISREIEIVIPSDPTTPDEPSNPGTPADVISIKGVDFNIDETRSYTVETAKAAVLDISLEASAGMEKVMVEIISPMLEVILKEENPFDLITPSATMKEILDGFQVQRPSKGAKTFVFKIGSFVPLLGEGEHKFKVTVTDSDNNSLTKTLSVKITA